MPAGSGSSPRNCTGRITGSRPGTRISYSATSPGRTGGGGRTAIPSISGVSAATATRPAETSEAVMPGARSCQLDTTALLLPTYSISTASRIAAGRSSSSSTASGRTVLWSKNSSRKSSTASAPSRSRSSGAVESVSNPVAMTSGARVSTLLPELFLPRITVTGDSSISWRRRKLR